MLASLTLAVSAIGYLFGLTSTAMFVSGASFLVFSISVFLCWLKFGRDILPLNSIWLVASYAASKLSLYRNIFSRKATESWTRTDREKNDKVRNDFTGYARKADK